VKQIEVAESEQTQLNASTLPLLGFGVVLTAANPLSELRWLNVVPLVLVLGLSLRVLVPIVVRWLRERKS
jgi:hypothetical protein